MKKILPLLFLLGACTPDIAQDQPVGAGAIVAQFDPANPAVAIVPQPNDLALTTGKIVVPIPIGCPNAAAAPPGQPATAHDGQKNGDETDVDCGGTSGNACDAGKACVLAEDCASTVCAAGACAGGCPSDAQQEFNKEYLGTLSGFPFESTASVSVSGDLDPASVTPASVLVLDITNPAAPAPVTNAPPVYANRTIVVPPPKTTGWTRGHRYAIALKSGDGGIKGAAGEPVIGSQTWYLVSSPNPLVTCPDLKTNCQPTVDIIPSPFTDPAQRLADQTAKAIQLEQLRLQYAPLLAGLAATGTPPANIPIAWTFTIVDAGEMTFDPTNSVIPFPNDILKDPTGAHVNLPNPTTGKPLAAADCAAATDLQVQLTCGLNTIDGFSTLVPPVSENSPTLGAAQQANLAAASLTKQSVLLQKLKSAAPTGIQTDVNFTPCLNCASSPDAAGKPQTSPQQLQWFLNAPLDEKTTYLGVVTSGVLDDKSKPVIANPTFALLRSSASLVANGKSTVTLITDDQANQLEPLRAAMKPAFDAIAPAGATRDKIALAFAFTTQSESTVLEQLVGAPAQAAALGLPSTPVAAIQNITAGVTPGLDATGVPHNHIGAFISATILTPVLVTGPGGTLNPTGAKILPVHVTIAIPNTAPTGASGYPVTIFGHGFTRWRNDMFAIANSLAAVGEVTISTDILDHGDRSSCTGSKVATAQTTDDASCATPATMKCDEDTLLGLCVLRDDTARNACTPGPGATGDIACATAGQGRCATDSKCQGAAADLARDASGRPLISGWNIFSLTNFFATRDNFRQQVVDLAQLVAVIKSTAVTPAPNLNAQLAIGLALPPGVAALDATKLGYVGQSLGGILGTLFNSVSPDTTNVVLNVPGGDLPQIILNAPSFAPQKAALLQALASQGTVPGTPAFDQFIGVVQWILDPADPSNMGYRMTHAADGAPNANRKTFIQFIEGDQTVPNISNFALVAGANRSFNPTNPNPPSLGCVAPLFCYEFTEAGEGFTATTVTPATRHGFLLSPPAGGGGLAVTGKAQTQVATFLATGALP